MRLCSGTFHVLSQHLPCAGVMDTVSAPRGVELDQPGRGRVTDGGLQAAAAQDHQRVVLRVQPGCATQAPRDKPEDARRLETQTKHPACCAATQRQRVVRDMSKSFRNGA